MSNGLVLRSPAPARQLPALPPPAPLPPLSPASSSSSSSSTSASSTSASSTSSSSPALSVSSKRKSPFPPPPSRGMPSLPPPPSKGMPPLPPPAPCSGDGGTTILTKGKVRSLLSSATKRKTFANHTNAASVSLVNIKLPPPPSTTPPAEGSSVATSPTKNQALSLKHRAAHSPSPSASLPAFPRAKSSPLQNKTPKSKSSFRPLPSLPPKSSSSSSIIDARIGKEHRNTKSKPPVKFTRGSTPVSTPTNVSKFFDGKLPKAEPRARGGHLRAVSLRAPVSPKLTTLRKQHKPALSMKALPELPAKRTLKDSSAAAGGGGVLLNFRRGAANELSSPRSNDATGAATGTATVDSNSTSSPRGGTGGIKPTPFCDAPKWLSSAKPPGASSKAANGAAVASPSAAGGNSKPRLGGGVNEPIQSPEPNGRVTLLAKHEEQSHARRSPTFNASAMGSPPRSRRPSALPDRYYLTDESSGDEDDEEGSSGSGSGSGGDAPRRFDADGAADGGVGVPLRRYQHHHQHHHHHAGADTSGTPRSSISEAFSATRFSLSARGVVSVPPPPISESGYSSTAVVRAHGGTAANVPDADDHFARNAIEDDLLSALSQSPRMSLSSARSRSRVSQWWDATVRLSESLSVPPDLEARHHLRRTRGTDLLASASGSFSEHPPVHAPPAPPIKLAYPRAPSSTSSTSAKSPPPAKPLPRSPSQAKMDAANASSRGGPFDHSFSSLRTTPSLPTPANLSSASEQTAASDSRRTTPGPSSPLPPVPPSSNVASGSQSNSASKQNPTSANSSYLQDLPVSSLANHRSFPSHDFHGQHVHPSGTVPHPPIQFPPVPVLEPTPAANPPPRNVPPFKHANSSPLIPRMNNGPHRARFVTYSNAHESQLHRPLLEPSAASESPAKPPGSLRAERPPSALTSLLRQGGRQQHTRSKSHNDDWQAYSYGASGWQKPIGGSDSKSLPLSRFLNSWGAGRANRGPPPTREEKDGGAGGEHTRTRSSATHFDARSGRRRQSPSVGDIKSSRGGGATLPRRVNTKHHRSGTAPSPRTFSGLRLRPSKYRRLGGGTGTGTGQKISLIGPRFDADDDSAVGYGNRKIAYERLAAVPEQCPLAAETRHRFALDARAAEMAQRFPPPDVHERKRFQVVSEMILSEQRYLSHLQMVIDVFIEPIQAFAHPSLSNSAHAAVFARNIKQISALHSKLVDQVVNDVVKAWHRQPELGDIFAKYSKLFTIYDQYARQYGQYTSIVDDSTSSDVLFKEFVQACHQHPRLKGYSLSMLAIIPLQRLPRYELLLNALIDSTPRDHADHASLANALEEVRVTTRNVNEALRAREQRISLIRVENSFAKGVQLVTPDRVLIREEVLTKMNRGGPKNYTFHLFSDLLTYSEETPSGLKLHRMIDLTTCFVNRRPSIPSNRAVVLLRNAFEIRSPGKSFLVCARNFACKMEWVRLIESCVAELKAKRGATSDSEAADACAPVAPLWEPDTSTTCSICAREFTLVARRHHCRRCGSLVCAKCSSGKGLLVHIDDSQAVRLCDACAMDLSRTARKSTSSSGDDGAGSRRVSFVHSNPKQNKSLRFFVAQMVLSDERIYNQTLSALNVAFVDPLRALFEPSLGRGKHGPSMDLSQPAPVLAIFASCLEQLHMLSSRFFRDLQANIALFEDRNQSHFCFGRIFCQYSEYFKLHVDFAKYAPRAVAFLAGQRFKHFVSSVNLHPALEGTALQAKLDLPLERVQEYHLLLKNLLSETFEYDVDYEHNRRACEEMRYVNIELERMVKVGRSQTFLQILENRFLGGIQLVDDNRALVHSGKLDKMNRQGPRTYEFHLFNDILISSQSTSAGLRIHRITDLANATVINIEDDPADGVMNAFEIESASKSFLLFAQSVQAKDEWLRHLTACTERMRRNPPKGTTAPVWMPNQESTECSLCGKGFTMVRRRHHCRRCGVLVCQTCASHRVILPRIAGEQRVRVCDSCFEQQC